MNPPVSPLRRRRLGVVHIVFFTVAASAPLTVLGGGVTTTFAVTGVTGVPLSFLIIAAALALFAVGYAAMSRFVANAGAFYAYIAHGLGATWAVAGAFIALISYNFIQISLYGLFGAAVGDLVKHRPHRLVRRWSARHRRPRRARANRRHDSPRPSGSA